MKNLLHVGCGGNNITSLPPHFQDGDWDEVRYDIDPSVQPDIVGRLQDMSILEDASFDAVYSSHNIEHVWAFEVPVVLGEFKRVIADTGFALILCPDMLSVANAVSQGMLESPLYESPAGPIAAMDIIYGHQRAIQQGNEFMAHRTAFTAQTMARHMLSAGFVAADIARDRNYGLHAVGYKSKWAASAANTLGSRVLPHSDHLIEVLRFGEFDFS